MLNLLIKDIVDQYIRTNFQRVQDALNLNPLTASQWIYRDVVFTQAETHKLIPHGLSFLPKDVIMTYKTGAGACTINWGLIDATNLNVTVTDACNVRFLIGRLGP